MLLFKKIPNQSLIRSLKVRNTLKFLSLFTILFIVTFGVSYAYDRWAPGDTAVIGEFVYDDNFVATTTAGCTVSIYNPSGTLIVNAGSMSASSNGWYSYNYSVPSSGPEGVWPTTMSCGSAPGGDLVKMDKTFSVGAVTVSSSTIATSVWSNASRTLTSVGTLLGDIWSYGTRTLTGASLSSGSLATQTDVTNASSSLASGINANTSSQVASAITSINNNTDAKILSASTTIGTLIASIPSSVWSYSGRTLTSLGSLASDVWSVPTRTLTSISSLASDVWNSPTRTLTSLTLSSQSPWTVSASDFGTIVAGSTYRATVTTVYNGTLTDSMVIPTITVYDPSRNVVVNAVSATRVATGTYEYSYTTSSGAEAGVWETVVSANVETGKTLLGNDYWNVTNSPAQVIINSISDDTVPSIASNVTITNEGLSGYEYQYEWCVVSDVNNSCGGGDDVFHAVAAKYINSGEDFNTTLTATVPSAGNYYFKLIVYFGTESSGASRSFTAVAGSGSGGGAGGGGGGSGGGGAGGGGAGGVVTPPSPSVDSGGSCGRADFNCDKKVNSIDFSILLYFWKTKPPFKNQYVDINKDSKIDSVDFSVLLYEWGKKY